jgi:hypothetical protein
MRANASECERTLDVREHRETIDHPARPPINERASQQQRSPRTPGALVADQESADRSYGYSEIARMFGRDHTTVVHGVLAYRRRVGPADPS